MMGEEMMPVNSKNTNDAHIVVTMYSFSHVRAKIMGKMMAIPRQE
jgi:hypothetical protein